MRRSTPVVQGETLIWRESEESHLLRVGTPAWYAWLEEATSFAFTSADGHYTIRKERRQRGGWYWRAYRSREKKALRAYVGKTEALTLDRLNEVATKLAGVELSEMPPLDIEVGVDNLASNGQMDGRANNRGRHLPEPVAVGTSTEALIATKLLRPPAGMNLVARPHLEALLDIGLRLRLTLISAAAGFGKTTLLSDWSRHTDCHVGWLSLDANDNEPRKFWSYLISALHTLRPSVGDEAYNLLHSPQKQSIETILTALINALTKVPQELALVIDDYHVIVNHSIHAGMVFLLDHLPPQIHLFVATRNDPPLPVARLRGKGQLNELRAADLSFTSAETATFLREVMRLSLTPEDVESLEKRTEGWIVGLQLAALSIKGHGDTHRLIKNFNSGHQHILEYLTEEVLSQQPEDVRNFLLQTSVLDRLCGSLCEAVTGQEGGQTTLEMLTRANLFTMPLDNERHWYRYHHLFAEVLRVWLHWAQPDLISDLHHRACDWYTSHGLIEQGVDHALAAGEFALAAELIERAAKSMLKRGENALIADWIRSLPDDLVRSRPDLCVVHAWALACTGNLAAADARLEEVERGLSMKGNKTLAGMLEAPRPEPVDVQRVLADVLAVRAMIATYRGNVPLVVAIYRQALALSPKDGAIVRSVVVRNLGSAYLRSGNVAGASRLLGEAGLLSQAAGCVREMIFALSELAVMQVVEGRLHEAACAYRKALQIVEDQETQPWSGAGAPHIGLGWLLYEWNDLDAATRLVTKGMELAKQEKSTLVMLLGYRALARLRQAQGDIDGALELLRQAEQIERNSGVAHNVERLVALKVRLWLVKGNVDAAVRWAETSGLDPDGEPSYRHESELLTLARVHIAQGKPTEAIQLLNRMLKAAEHAGRTGSAIKILALRSLALWAVGDRNEALATLERALSAAEPEGYVRTFVDLGRPMIAQLTELLGLLQQGLLTIPLRVSLGYVRRLIEAFDPKAARSECRQIASEIAGLAVEPLSAREIEVLRLVATGQSAEGIAQLLVVAVSTVRTHIKNIYAKLDVHNRQQALRRAQDLSLLA